MIVFDDIHARKAFLRKQTLARRDALDPDYRAKASLKIAERVLALEALRSCKVIGGYWPIRSEVDIRPLLHELRQRGHLIALPRIEGDEMRFHLWEDGEALMEGPFSLRQPSQCRLEVKPDMLLVPVAAFDRQGGRIGYGKGYYDCFLSKTPFPAIGIAFTIQCVNVVPLERHDIRLDQVVTEEG